MKIAIYSGSIPSTTFIEHLIKGVSKTHQVHLFGAKRGKVHYNSDRVRTVYTPTKRISAFIITFFRLLLLLVKYPKRFKIAIKESKSYSNRYTKFRFFVNCAGVLLYLPDLFHIQWAKDLERWIFLKEELGVKLILSLRGAHINYSPLYNEALATSYRTNFHKVDGFHAVSNAIAKEATKYNANNDKIEVIHSILNLKQLPKKTYRWSKQRPIRLLSVGRFHWVKGYRYALDAIKYVKDTGVAITYTIVAQGETPEEILHQIHQLDLKNEVKIINGLSQQDVFGQMTLSDCLLLPSINEGIANVVLEAMAIGLPVISTNCGGMAEVVTPKKTGWLVPVRDAKAMSMAILEFNDSPDETISDIVKNAKSVIESEFNPETNLQHMLNLYHGVIKK